jgi:hypothetical protein
MSDDEQEYISCPACGREELDFDGFILAHTKPAYENGCGWCSHPSRDDGVCGICGDIDSGEDAPAFDRVLPDLSAMGRAEGWRLHVFRESGEMTILAEEQVLPEKIDDPNANRVKNSTRIWLSRDEMLWLRDQFTELLGSD